MPWAAAAVWRRYAAAGRGCTPWTGQDVSSLLLPVDSLFQDSPPVRLTPRQERACRDGAAFSLNLAPGTYRLYGASEFLALGRCDEGRMRTIKSFFEVN